MVVVFLMEWLLSLTYSGYRFIETVVIDSLVFFFEWLCLGFFYKIVWWYSIVEVNILALSTLVSTHSLLVEGSYGRFVVWSHQKTYSVELLWGLMHVNWLDIFLSHRLLLLKIRLFTFLHSALVLRQKLGAFRILHDDILSWPSFLLLEKFGARRY